MYSLGLGYFALCFVVTVVFINPTCVLTAFFVAHLLVPSAVKQSTAYFTAVRKGCLRDVCVLTTTAH